MLYFLRRDLNILSLILGLLFVASCVTLKYNEANLKKLKSEHPGKEYMGHVVKKIYKNWNKRGLRKNGDKITEVSFIINRDGCIGDSLKIKKSSGNYEFDRRAIEAVERSEPFDPLPQSYKKDFFEINYGFSLERK